MQDDACRTPIFMPTLLLLAAWLLGSYGSVSHLILGMPILLFLFGHLLSRSERRTRDAVLGETQARDAPLEARRSGLLTEKALMEQDSRTWIDHVVKKFLSLIHI